VVPASAGDIARDLLVPGGIAAGAVTTAYHALALLVKTPLLAWSERVSPRWFSVGCLIVLALSTLAAGLATHPIALALALTFYGPASGGALSVAEGLLVESRAIAVPAMAVLGAATSPLHPLVSARAYASLPGRPALVNAVSATRAPIDALAPLLLAAIAVTWGSGTALLAIGVAPLGIALMAWRARSTITTKR